MALLLCLAPGLAYAAEPIANELADAAQLAFFEAKIRPVLVAHCYACHSAAEGVQEGSLRLDTREGLLAGGDRGPAVVPGKPAASLLLTAVSHDDPDLKMPPKREQLPAAVIADLRTWIERGAVDPRVDGAPAQRPTDEAAARHAAWAFSTPTAQPLPATSDPAWARRDLDHFILARLDAAGLTPSPDAPPATLLRRLHFDLVGLPPTPPAIAAFLDRVAADGLDAALAAEVDALLATPQFGERWGRHWLDVARYAESSGKEANISFPYAWRYRDYVIDAVNADTPFDRFLVEQLAGDLLPAANDAERARLLIATGWLALGPKNLDEADARQFAADLVDEQIDAVTRAVLAQSVACARCHDHKFDPFTMHDYYALAGVFASTRTYFGTFVSPANRVGGDPLVLPRGAEQPILHPSIPAARVTQLKEQQAALQKEQREGMAAALRASVTGGDPEQQFSLRDALRIFWTSGGIKGQLDKVDDEGRALPLAMGVRDRLLPADARLLERGEIARPGARVPRGFPQAISLSDTPPIPREHSGRRELAQWLTHPEQPLTGRVFVNRAWRHLFGAGLVRTVDNFGANGEPPSHPELLDHLAARFVADGWSLKLLVRELTLSRAYRQASAYRAEAFRADPDNRLLWRATPRRLDAEAIRDAMLHVSGELDLARPAGSLVARSIGDRPISLIGLDPRLPADLDGAVHRSVYLPILRDRLPDVLDLFDFAEPSLVTGDRATTNVPLQALYLLNSPFVQARAEALAARVRGAADDPAQRIAEAYRLCLGRTPDDDERARADQFFAAGQAWAGDNPRRQRQLWTAYCQSLLATAEFRLLD